MTIVYKITKMQGDRHFSYFAFDEWQVEYIPGLVTHPPDRTYLLAYDTLENVDKEYTSDDSFGNRYAIWQAEAEVIGPVAYLMPLRCDPRMARVLEFWELGRWMLSHSRAFSRAPLGTVACASITLTERL